MSETKSESTVVQPKFSARVIVFTAVCIALGFSLSFVRIFHFPWGGSITLCSMLPIALIGYFFGPYAGLLGAFLYGVLQFFQGGAYFVSPLQVCLDYFVAFAALGVSGFFYTKKNGLLIGYVTGILIRGALHAIGGYIYWMDYMPEEFPASLAVIYPIVYNYAYIIGEGIITVILISLPPVKKAINRVRIMAIGT